MTDQPDLLAAVLAAHQPVGWHRTATVCACGHRCDPAGFAAHQGDVLADAGLGDLRKPLGEAVEAELARQRAEAALSALLADLQAMAESDLLSQPLDDLIARHTPEVHSRRSTR